MKMNISIKDVPPVILYSVIIGVTAPVLTRLGNPVDGGISITCFMRDLAGAFGFHQIMEFSYIRPELAGIVFGVLGISLLKRSFQPTCSGSSLVYFLIGFLVALAAFVFIGCPLRLFLRLGSGDPASLSALAGLIGGVWVGTLFLRRGFALDRKAPAAPASGLIIHAVVLLALFALIFRPAMITLTNGSHAPLIISLCAGLLAGAAAQRGKICFVSPFRNLFIARDLTWIAGLAAMTAAIVITNLALDQMHWGVTIVGSNDPVWNFLALFAVGLGSTMVDGCPFRQLVQASQGSTDSALYLAGIAAGGAAAYNLSIAYMAGSIDLAGKIAVIASITVLTSAGFVYSMERKH